VNHLLFFHARPAKLPTITGVVPCHKKVGDPRCVGCLEKLIYKQERCEGETAKSYGNVLFGLVLQFTE
jgi:hypothetical protein